MKRIIITALALAALGGVASADHGRHNGPVVRDHRTWNAPARVYAPSRTYAHPSYSYSYSRPSYGYGYARPSYHVYSHPSYRYARHPIYVRRPAISYRYYDYYSRPTVIAESYPQMPGYIWVAGAWQWNGYEWVWQSGHYEPDPSYSGDYYYQGTYDNGAYYYDSSYQPSVSAGVSFSAGF